MYAIAIVITLCDNIQHSMTIKGQQLHGRAINVGLKGAQVYTNLELKGTKLLFDQRVMTTFHPNNPPMWKGYNAPNALQTFTCTNP